MHDIAAIRPKRIRVISICLFCHDGRILASEGFDRVKQSHYYRPLGGGVETGETAAEALRREIHEELQLAVSNLRLMTVLENLFVLDGEPGHEIVFVFDGQFEDRSVYEQEVIEGQENDGRPLKAVWRSIDSFDDKRRLVPESLAEVIAGFVGQ